MLMLQGPNGLPHKCNVTEIGRAPEELPLEIGGPILAIAERPACHLTRRLFAAMVRRIDALPAPAG